MDEIYAYHEPTNLYFLMLVIYSINVIKSNGEQKKHADAIESRMKFATFPRVHKICSSADAESSEKSVSAPPAPGPAAHPYHRRCGAGSRSLPGQSTLTERRSHCYAQA
jgi:hypothetical protein